MPQRKFDGSDYDPKIDNPRLKRQMKRVFDLMIDGQWRTLREISDITGDAQTSISAQLRHLRKERFGAYVVEKRSRGLRELGLYEYRVLKPVRKHHQLIMEGILRRGRRPYEP